MKIYQKVILWSLLSSYILPMFNQEDTNQPCIVPMVQQENIVWEKYIPLSPIPLLAALCIWSFYGETKDFAIQKTINEKEKSARNNLEHIKIEEKALEDFKQSIIIYYPQTLNKYTSSNHIIQIANETQRPIIFVDQNKIKCSEKHVHLFFQHAEKIGPCIIYIEKEMKIEFEHEFKQPLFFNSPFFHNHYFSDTITPIILDRIKSIQKNPNIIILGIAKNKELKITQDITHYGFNIQEDNPSYHERVEFIALMIEAKNLMNINIKNIAQKTIGFSYEHLIQLMQKAGNLAIKTKNKIITNAHLDNAYQDILKHQINISCFNNSSLENTCIHEIGHALATVHFKQNFTLQNVIATPQNISSYDYIYGITNNIQYGKNNVIKYYRSQNTTEIDLEHIMICCAGKIAEQIFYEPSLSVEQAYTNFINNPGTAEHDLKTAQKLAENIIQNNKIIIYTDAKTLIKDLYKKTFEIMLQHKNTIPYIAKILEQEEFLSGSQIYEICKENADKAI